MASGGRGKKGGLSEYARQVGKTHQYASQIVLAAKVATQVAGLANKKDLLEKAKHLSHISKTMDILMAQQCVKRQINCLLITVV